MGERTPQFGATLTGERASDAPAGDTRIAPIPPQPTEVLGPQSTEILPLPPLEEAAVDHPAEGPISPQPTRVLPPYQDAAEVGVGPFLAPPGVLPPGAEPAELRASVPEVPVEPRPDWLPADSPWPLPTNVPEVNLTTGHGSRLPWWMDDSRGPSLVPVIVIGTVLVVLMLIAVGLRSGATP